MRTRVRQRTVLRITNIGRERRDRVSQVARYGEVAMIRTAATTQPMRDTAVELSVNQYRSTLRRGKSMYCSSCGGVVAQGLSYCKNCGAKLSGVKGDSIIKSPEVRPETLVWGMVAVLVFGFVAIMFLMLAMKMVGLDVAFILAFTILSFLIMLSVEGVFISQFLRRKRGAEETGDTALSRERATKEVEAAQARVLPEPVPSVTEHTTRAFDPIYSERKSK